jgi:hypothetical protein
MIGEGDLEQSGDDCSVKKWEQRLEDLDDEEARHFFEQGCMRLSRQTRTARDIEEKKKSHECRRQHRGETGDVPAIFRSHGEEPERHERSSREVLIWLHQRLGAEEPGEAGDY